MIAISIRGFLCPMLVYALSAGSFARKSHEKCVAHSALRHSLARDSFRILRLYSVWTIMSQCCL